MKPRLYHFGIAYLHQCFGVYPESLALKQYLEGSCWLRFIILLKSDCVQFLLESPNAHLYFALTLHVT